MRDIPISVAVSTPHIEGGSSSGRSTEVVGSHAGAEPLDESSCQYLEEGRRRTVLPRRVVVASWLSHYGFETRWWLDVITFIILGALTLVIHMVDDLQPDEPYFFERDPAISYPLLDETVPTWSAGIIAVAVPLVAIITLQFQPFNIMLNPPFNYGLLNVIVYVENFVVTVLLTEAAKNLTGRLRPNFLASCDYKGYRTAIETGDFTEYFAATVPGRFGDYKECRRHFSSNAIKSFPSGHASTVFNGCIYLCMFIWFGIRTKNRFTVLAVTLFIIALAGFITISRVYDYYHSTTDVLGGTFIGVSIAAAMFSLNFLPWTFRELSKQRNH